MIFFAGGTQLSAIIALLSVHSSAAAVVVREKDERHPDAVIGIIDREETDEILARESDLFSGKNKVTDHPSRTLGSPRDRFWGFPPVARSRSFRELRQW